MELQEEIIIALREENRLLQESISVLTKSNDVLTKSNHILTEKVDLLLKELSNLKHKKNSRNSSLPPSSDISRPSKSLREKSVRKSGGQVGHSGSTLSQIFIPNETIALKVTECSSCGCSLSDATYELKTIRQVVDIAPPPPPKYVEYQQYSCTCPHCHEIHTAPFPANVTAPIQYGPTVHALVSYFSVYQYIPYNRLQKMLSEVFHLPMSQGSIDRILNRSAQRAMVVYNRIRENIETAPVVGSDETSAKVSNQSKWWIWVWQTITDTFLVASKTRGYASIDEQWKNGLVKGVLVSDRWAAQLKTTAVMHQICLAHLLRDIIFVEDCEKSDFITKLKELILEIFAYKKKMTILVLKGSSETEYFEEKLNKLLAIPLNKEEVPRAYRFQIALIKIRGLILPCIYDPDIPPDNNGSERALRNIRVKMNVSKQFKKGQQIFCILRSVIDTLNKRKLPIWEMLCQIMELKPTIAKTT